MPIPDKEQLNKLEELKGKLFSKSYKTKIEYKDTFPVHERIEVPESWPEEKISRPVQKIMMKTSVFKKIFFLSLIFLLASAGYVSYMFFAGGNTVSNSNIDITILGNAFTSGGEELPLQVEIVNRNNTALELVDLVLEYPTGSIIGNQEEKERIRESLGSIPAGGIRNETVEIVLFGEQGSTREIKVSLEYRLEGSNAIFIKEKTHEVIINSTPINLVLEAPEKVNPNQTINLGIKASVNSTDAVAGILVKLDYPLGFEFISSVPVPTYGNNVWSLGDMSPGAEQNIKITGRMIDVFDGEEKTFHVFSGSQSTFDKTDIGTVFNSLAHTLDIENAFLEAQILVDGYYEDEYPISSRSAVRGSIRWTNNMDVMIKDLEIKLKPSGPLFDRRQVSVPSPGFYDSINETIVWDRNGSDSFREVSPGARGGGSFNIQPISVLSAGSGLIKDPYLDLELVISGKRVIDNEVVEVISSTERKRVKIITDIGLVVKALHFVGPFKNTGPIPPKAENETTYTITWAVSNTTNNVSNAKVVSSLLPYVKFVGTVSPSNEKVTFNPSTREIVWDIGKIPSGTGIEKGAREVSFQISITPSLSQVNSSPLFTSKTTLTAFDDFANVDVETTKAGVGAALKSDPYFPANGSSIVE